MIKKQIPIVKDNPFPQTDRPMNAAEKKEAEKEMTLHEAIEKLLNQDIVIGDIDKEVLDWIKSAYDNAG